MKPCEDCQYLQDERAGMWIDNGASLAEAIEAGSQERCPEHKETQTELFADFDKLRARTQTLLS